MVLLLNSVRSREFFEEDRGYPFEVPVIQSFDELELTAPVTFFIGENGSGKSTLLEAIAAAAGSITVGGNDIRTDETLEPARRLGAKLILSWSKRSHRGFFMRSEDFFNYASRNRQAVTELDEMAREYAEERARGGGRNYGLQLAEGAVRGQRAALVSKYGEDLDARSHGESFFKLFQSRFVPGGLYLLDEPDTALSPQRQLALLSMLKQMVAEDAQFIIATHAPILLAFPGATILSFDDGEITPIAYEATSHVTLTRSFLSDPERYLRQL
jgi:predicted ATPase